MNKGLIAVMFAVLFLYILGVMLKDILLQLKYTRDDKRKETGPTVEQLLNEQPLFVLEYESYTVGKIGRLLGLCILVLFSLWLFFYADWLAGGGSRKPLLWLNEQHSYALTVWAYRAISIGAISIIGLNIMYWFDKRVSFYNHAVMLENSLGWRRVLALDDNARITRVGGRDCYVLYNVLSSKRFIIVNRRLMFITLHQEQALKEFLNRVPEEQKAFMLNY